jgi:hypothetical protein|tara:strand:+ start:261 stop:572 length:312 start_codon:yes stop_codon:yes gene_type:complete
MLKSLLKRMREYHDVSTGVECGQPQSVRHEKHGFAVVTRSLDAVVLVLIKALSPSFVMMIVEKLKDISEKIPEGLLGHLSIHLKDKLFHVLLYQLITEPAKKV